MKVFNLIALSLGGALLIVMGISVLSEAILGKESAMFVVMPVALIVGFNARRTTEKILGYTLLEALKEGSNDTDGN